MEKLKTLDEFKSWAKENGFIYPSSEIYGGFAAVYDYGHYGILLKNNIQRAWEKSMVQERNDILMLDSGIFMHPKTWVASGHVGGFDDVLVEDKKTHTRYRADHLVEEACEKIEFDTLVKHLIEYVNQEEYKVLDNRWVSHNGPNGSEPIFLIRKGQGGELTIEDFKAETKDLDALEYVLPVMVARIYNQVSNNKLVDLDKASAKELEQVIKILHIKSPQGNDLTEPRAFNLLVKSNMGTTDSSFSEENVTYLRGETCQGIYLEYKNYRDTLRPKLPFGIAQVGKAFRNEIIARQFVFRTREFEQMEMQYFHKPADKQNLFEMWKETRMKWHVEELGINPDKLRFKKHEKLVFYASQAFDIEYNYETLGGFKELEGLHDRGDYDLTQHSKFSGEKLDYFDQETGERLVPHIMETSVGLNRILMMVLEDAYTKEELTNSKGEKDSRVVLKLKKSLAPIKVAILPLSKKPELQQKALEVQDMIKSQYMTQYDETASIGKRYRRQDEVGTPYCVTIDFETLNDQAVTIRDRDTMQQDRIKISDLVEYLNKSFK
ncbi:MAG: glycine--tRNA ligase [Candidatus Dojkabacteria bacterium]